MSRLHLSSVPPCVATAQHGAAGPALSPGVSSGSRFDPHAFRRSFPDRWSAFLRAHHRDATEVAFFYGVTDRAARDWWEGTSGPKGAVVAMAAQAQPEGFAAYILGDAA
jgi:hypothetical protein